LDFARFTREITLPFGVFIAFHASMLIRNVLILLLFCSSCSIRLCAGAQRRIRCFFSVAELKKRAVDQISVAKKNQRFFSFGNFFVL